MALAAATGAAVALLTPARFWETRMLTGWLIGAVSYLAVVWLGVGSLDAVHTRLRAVRYDPGNRALYAVVVAACFVSLGGVLLVTDASRAMSGAARWWHIVLALTALAATWLLIQTVFALRYAHRYYHRDAGGLLFPGHDAPTYVDFAYFSAVIGMTSQVADVDVATVAMRRLVLAHGLVSFAFNLLILALTLNLVAGALA